MIRRLLYYLGLVELVWTIDMDGKARLRVVRFDEKGGRYVHGITSERSMAQLQPNGTVICTDINGPSYVKRWQSYPSLKPERICGYRRRFSWLKPSKRTRQVQHVKARLQGYDTITAVEEVLGNHSHVYLPSSVASHSHGASNA